MKFEIVNQNGKDVLCIVIPVDPESLANAKQSKSALAKAAEKGLAASTVPATLVASTGGFTACGPVKVSLNVTKA
jgi:hypothetical protein